MQIEIYKKISQITNTLSKASLFFIQKHKLGLLSRYQKIYKEARKSSIFNKDFDENTLNNLDKRIQLCFVFDKSKIIQWNSPT